MSPRQLALQISPEWVGDLEDDCTARWAGFTLRAEWMQDDVWWWCVYDDSDGEQVASSNSVPDLIRSGDSARKAAEAAARAFLGFTGDASNTENGKLS